MVRKATRTTFLLMAVATMTVALEESAARSAAADPLDGSTVAQRPSVSIDLLPNGRSAAVGRPSTSNALLEDPPGGSSVAQRPSDLLPKGRSAAVGRPSTSNALLEDTPGGSSVAQRPRKRNELLLTQLGLSRTRSPLNHHRKRLATTRKDVASPSNDASEDSHVYVIKLPPNPYYYAHEDALSRHAPDKTNQLDVGFKSNGKPSKVYHYNLPVVKKMVRKTRPQSESQVFKLQSTWPASLSDKARHHYGGKTSYYKPRRPATLRKYFPGNGKPQSMYVIQRSRLQPTVTYRRLLLP